MTDCDDNDLDGRKCEHCGGDPPSWGSAAWRTCKCAMEPEDISRTSLAGRKELTEKPLRSGIDLVGAYRPWWRNRIGAFPELG